MNGEKEYDGTEMERETEMPAEGGVTMEMETNNIERLTAEEKVLIENSNSPKEKSKRGRKKKVDEIRGRERANSVSIID